MQTEWERELSDILVKGGFIKYEKLEEITNEQQKTKERLEKLLIRLKILTKKEILKALEKYYRITAVDLEDKAKIEIETLKLLPERLIKRYNVIPLGLAENRTHIMVAMSNPRNRNSINDIRFITGYEIEPYVATEGDILTVIEKYYTIEVLDDILKKLGVSEEILEKEVVAKAQEVMDGSPLIRLVNVLLSQAVKKMASDIHIEPQDKFFYVRYRIDGLLYTAHVFSPRLHPNLISRIKLMGGMNIAEKRLPQDGQFRMKINERNIDFRVSTFPGKYGEKIVLRILDRTTYALGLSQLGFNPTMLAEYEDIIRQPHGIILVTGPTGSGKTTTLYATLIALRSPTKNIVTLEEPIEYELLSESSREAGITQSEVKPEIGYDFVRGLRAILRQDPDIIMVGEIRDLETARVAIRSALTGHLVLSTLHTNDAPSVVVRLVDMGAEAYLVASSIIAVVAQRLVRILCPACKVPYTIPPKAMKLFGFQDTKGEPVTLYRTKGCDKCSYTGYRGRTAVFELFKMTEEMRRLVLERASSDAIKEASKKAGMRTLRENGLDLVMQGITTAEEIYRVAEV